MLLSFGLRNTVNEIIIIGKYFSATWAFWDLKIVAHIHRKLQKLNVILEDRWEMRVLIFVIFFSICPLPFCDVVFQNFVLVSADSTHMAQYQHSFLDPSANVDIMVIGPDPDIINSFEEQQIPDDLAIRLLNADLPNIEWNIASYTLSEPSPISVWNDHICHGPLREL